MNPAPCRFILAASALALVGPSVSAAVLEEFTFGTTPPSVLTPTTVAPGISASAITAGSAAIILDVNSNQGNPPASSPWLRINPTAGYPTAADAIAANADFRFSLAPIPGFTMSLTSLDFRVARGGNSTRGYALQTSVDGFSSILSTADVADIRPNFTPVSVDLSGASFQDLSSLTFKIFSYSPNSGASVEYDDIVVNGTATFGGYTWQGSTGNWDTTSANWTGTGTTYVDNTAASNVLFGDAGNVTTVNVAAGGMNPNLITFTNSPDKPYTFTGGDLDVATTLFKSGEGKVTFRNTVAADSVTADRGTLEIGADGSLTGTNVTVSQSGLLLLAAGGAFNATNLTVNGNLWAENDFEVETLTGAAPGMITLDSAVLEVTGTSTYAGTITGNGSLLKSTGGTLTLTAANSHSEGTTITGGALQLDHVNAASFGPVSVNTGGILSLGAAVSNEIILNGGSLGVSKAVTTPAILTVSDDSTIKTFNPITDSGSAELIVTGVLQGSGDINFATLNGNNPDGGAAFRLRGPASIGENAYSGTITVNQSAKLELQTDLESGSPMGTGKLVMVGGETTSNANGTYSLVNVRNNSTGSTTFGNDVAMSGTGAAYFNMLGSAPLGSAMNFGKLTIGDGQAVAAVATNSATSFTLGFASVELTGGNATFTPQPVGNGSFVATQNISLGAVFERTAGSGITMNGAATLTLTANNNYTGPTRVQSGTLAVNGSISGSTVELSGGTLRGTGTTGSVNVFGGTIAPGNGVGSLNTGSVAFDMGGFALEIGGNTEGTYGQLKVTGGLAFNAPINLTLDFSAYDPVDGDTFVIASNDLADPITFADENSGLFYDFVPLKEGMIFTATSEAFTQAFKISYVGGTNANDIVLTAVPEPSTMVALIGGVAMLAGVRRRRR